MNPTVTFGEALEALKSGKRVARMGWNGKGMFLYLVYGMDGGTTCILKEAPPSGANCVPECPKIGDHINMKAADGSIVVGWLASQTDMLAEDWVILED